MLPKKGCTGEPEQYRPITCLNVAYKLLTGPLTAILTEHVMTLDLLPKEQRALRKGARGKQTKEKRNCDGIHFLAGCLDALVVDNAVTKEARMWRRNLSVAWIDYKKAFDMTPHAWIRDLLKAMRAPHIVRSALAGLIPKWQTTITLRGRTNSTRSRSGSEEDCTRATPYPLCCSA